MSTNAKRPTHKVYAVTKGNKRNFWREIGAAWEHSDGDGFNVQLLMLPLNGAEIVIRKPKDDAEEGDMA